MIELTGNGFVLETHMHTREGSACASLDAVSQVRQYKEAGYDGIIVTDHFVTGNSAVDRSLTWTDQMNAQFEGYRRASEEGAKVGLAVFCGIEFAYHGTEFLVIGLDEEWFTSHPQVTEMKPEEFLELFRSEGAAVVQAHPFREAYYINKIRLYPEYVDAIEVYNHLNEAAWDEKAAELAAGAGLPGTSGSDCHHLGRIGGGIVLDRAPRDIDDLKSMIRSGEIRSLIRGRES